MLLNQPMQTLVPTSSATSQPSQCNMGISQNMWVHPVPAHTHLHACTGLNSSFCGLQIHVGAADHRTFVLHAASQLQRRPGALSGLHVLYNDPTQQFHHQPVPFCIPHTAPGFPALPAAATAAAVLSSKTAVCFAALHVPVKEPFSHGTTLVF